MSAAPGNPGQTDTPRDPTEAVIDPQGAFWFTLPAGWQVQQQQPREDAMARDINSPDSYATLTTENVRDGFTLDEYMHVSLARVQQSYSQYLLTPDSVREITTGGKPARTYRLFREQGETRVRVLRFVVLNATAAYTITFIAPEANADVVAAQAQIVVDTFTFTP